MRFTPGVVIKWSLIGFLLSLVFLFVLGLLFPTSLAALAVMSTTSECESAITVCLASPPTMPWDQYAPDSQYTLHEVGFAAAFALILGSAMGMIAARAWIPGKAVSVPPPSAAAEQPPQHPTSMLLQHPDPATAHLLHQQMRFGGTPMQQPNTGPPPTPR